LEKAVLVDLSGKNVLLGVTGSIAAYKSLEIVRMLIKSGASVKVVMTTAAQRFVGKLSFEALSANEVIDGTSESWADANNHIALSKWADIFIIAPASANTLNKLSNGIADNILTQCALACTKPKLLAPAANVHMLESPITQASLKMLKICGYEIIDTQTKLLACNDEGNGAMAEPLEIYYNIARVLMQDSFWMQRRVVVTSGGTIEKIDDVRCLSNFSSGKMGYSIALMLYLMGADVCLITSSDPFVLPLGIYKLEAQSSKQMQEYLIDAIRVAKKGVLSKVSLMDDQTKVNLIQKKPYLFMVAAVSDYLPTFVQEGKIKKEQLGDEWKLSLIKNQDLLASVDKSEIISIGFKAELDAQNALLSAQKMLDEKELDAVCLNVLQNAQSFGSDQNSITFITKESQKTTEGSKITVAKDIIMQAKELC
jgi:phosphopantothenoylcysteine decarboxylase/phosphopantothenate--cysteine ligase